ncbi:MAG: NADH dehydrogenase subunit C [Methanomassiliicoccales archaeon PtaU1.Bin124]|nr:MAG: NADH dehydrogenase subunit C [Methanomassiliicoccales archaeon PtaU1.Bin124]
MTAPNEGMKNELERMSPRPRLIDVMVADRRDGSFDLVYVFQDGHGIKDLRCVFQDGEELESISSLYSGALYMEKEAAEMFGVRFKGVDGLFLLDEASPKAPLRLPRKEVGKDG